MVSDEPWYESVSFPALLRAARSVYGQAMRAAMADAGCDDVPRNGMYVLGAIARGALLSDVLDELGMSRANAHQLVDTLVARGYLERLVDPDDERRATVVLTARGRAASDAARAAAERLDAEAVGRVGADHVARTRATLASIIEASRSSD